MLLGKLDILLPALLPCIALHCMTQLPALWVDAGSISDVLSRRHIRNMPDGSWHASRLPVTALLTEACC